ncbi:hypothetical protein AB0B78_29720 [Streptomyces sp. NPDC040724]|uniref:hypothetical protein n=1 Tax=Streptomyces sp. NPDC040724 TaxID=3155612 RepID=UPI0033CD4CEC
MQPAAHSRMVSTAREVPPEREAGLLIGSRQWPLLAVRTQQICEDGGLDVIAAHLARPSTDTAWKKATGATVPGRIVDANLAFLTTPPSAPAPSRPLISPTASRSRCTPEAALPTRRVGLSGSCAGRGDLVPG